jgi:hypothetical protein
MELGDKRNASAKKDLFISPDVAKPLSNPCNLRIISNSKAPFVEMHILPFSSSALICVHLRLSSSVRSSRFIRVHSRLICGPAADKAFDQSGQVVAITAF